MSATDNDLWPDDFGTSGVVTPVTILREQASLLGPKTKHVVEAEVHTSNSPPHIVHTLNLIAPALDGYIYRLLRLQHQIELYPVIVVFEATSTQYSAESQDELKALLKQIFSHQKTVSIIRSLIVQSAT